MSSDRMRQGSKAGTADADQPQGIGYRRAFKLLGCVSRPSDEDQRCHVELPKGLKTADSVLATLTTSLIEMRETLQNRTFEVVAQLDLDRQTLQIRQVAQLAQVVQLVAQRC